MHAAAIAMASTNTQLLVVGDGNRLQDMEELAGTRAGHHPAEPLHRLRRTLGDLPALYRSGSVFVITSELESEGIVILEAAACGVPIVAVRATSMPELVEEAGCGYLVPPGDVHAMADRIVQVLRDPAAQPRPRPGGCGDGPSAFAGPDPGAARTALSFGLLPAETLDTPPSLLRLPPFDPRQSPFPIGGSPPSDETARFRIGGSWRFQVL